METKIRTSQLDDLVSILLQAKSLLLNCKDVEVVRVYECNTDGLKQLKFTMWRSLDNTKVLLKSKSTQFDDIANAKWCYEYAIS